MVAGVYYNGLYALHANNRGGKKRKSGGFVFKAFS